MNGSRVINEILKREGLKPGTFAKKIGVTPTQIYDLQNGKTQNVSAKVAEKIMKAYPQYLYSWLLSGEGCATKGELRSEDSPEIEIKDGKVKVDFKKLWENQEKKGVGKEWMKVYLEAPKIRKGMVERIRVAMPEARSVRPSMAFQHLLNTNPTLALWAATGKDDKVVVNRSNYETALAKLATLERLTEIQSKELRELKGESNIEPIAKLF